MSKYHKGDKFIVEIKEVMNSDNGTLYRSNFKTLTFDDNGLDKLQKYEQPTISEDTLEMERIKAMNDGRNEVWELARKIFTTDCATLQKVFGHSDEGQIIMTNEPQEALAKLEAYEIEQTEIKEGDIFEFNHSRCCVISTNNKIAKVLWKSGDTGNFEVNFLKRLPKKGFVDIKSVLKQIGGSDV